MENDYNRTRKRQGHSTRSKDFEISTIMKKDLVHICRRKHQTSYECYG